MTADIGAQAFWVAIVIVAVSALYNVFASVLQ
jgi:hypothetical protein